MTSRSILGIGILAAGAALAGADVAQAAEPFAAAGARATLTVDYRYESSGKKQDRYDLHEWRVARSVQITADLAAHKEAPTPQLQQPDAAYMAEQQKKAKQAEALSAEMAPMMASAEQILAKCGEDEACITRESQKLGAAMAGTPELAQAQQAGKQVEELGRIGGPRYQTWRATAQKGSYAIDESEHIVHSDPICMSLPGARCTRDELRRGAGALPAVPGAAKDPHAAAGFAAVEVDAEKNTLTLVLPAPLSALPYTETITTDEPEGTHETPTPKGPQARQQMFRVGPDGKGTAEPITVALAGGWRSQSGERVVKIAGAAGEGGTLTVRWRFQVHT